MAKFVTCPACSAPRDPDTFVGIVCSFCHEDGRLPEEKQLTISQKSQNPVPITIYQSQEPSTEPYTPPKFDAAAAKANPHAELAARTLARRRLMPFIKRFRPKYDAGWVHEDICRRLERFLKAVENGEEPRLLLMMPPRAGKQLADDTLIPTPTGWTLHGELRPGNWVFHPSGKPVKVLAVSEKTTSNVKVTFSDGSEFYCHENHEWTLYNRMRQEWQVIETRHFLENTRFGIKKQITSAGRSTYQLPVVKALQFTNSEFTMEPYVLGAWLGDGSAGKPCITGAKLDKPIISRIESLGYNVSTVCEHSTTKVLTTYFSGTPQVEWPGKMTRELQQLGIYTDKRIPEHYQYLSVKHRLELLAGLVDTDGTTDKNSRITFTTVSRKLAEDVLQLCEGLGFRPYLREVQPSLSTSGIQGKKVCYIVGFQPTMEIPVALERKRITRFAQQRRVGLVSVERVDSGKQGNCIQVDSPDGLYVVGRNLITTHNSEIGSRHFAPWVLGQHPDWEIIAASHTTSLSLSFSRYIRDLLRDPAYHAVFPDAILDPQSQSTENWNLTEGGGYLAAGVGSAITGRGAHILILDDLVKDIEAADSQLQRDATWEWYISTAHSRLAPGGGVLGIMTWWSEDDWAGRIQQVMAGGEGEQFEIVRYPAINEVGDEYILPDDTIMEIPAGAPVPEGAVMTRPHMSALHEARYTIGALLRKKANYIAAGLKRMWDSLYQQNPTPDEGIYFAKNMFRLYVHNPDRRGRFIYQAWDFAITEGEQNDWTVGGTMLQDEYDNLYLLDVLRFKSGDGNEIIETIIDYQQQWNADLIGFEDGQIWKALSSQFSKRCQERRVYPTFEVLTPFTDKMVRANPLKGRMQLGKVYFPEKAAWFPEYQRELLRFPAGKHDDQVDMTAWLVRLTLSRSAPTLAKPKELASWRDKLNNLGSDRGGAMAA